MGMIGDAKRKYDLKAGERKIDFENKRRKIIRENPDIAAALKELNNLWAKALEKGIPPEQTESAAKKLTAALEGLLAQKGYEKDCLNYRPLCPKCSDSGYSEGKMCSCLAQFVLNECYAASGISQIIKRENFDSFDESVFSASPDDENGNQAELARKARNTCLQFAEEFDRNYSNLLIRGKTGTGKSFLTHCIAKAAIDRGKTVLYVTGYGMIDALTKSAVGEADDSFYENLISCDLLIIDDLGTERQTDFSENMLYKVLNERMNSLKPIVFSTNLTVREINEIYDERVTSRIFSVTKGINMPGRDLRYLLKNTPITE